MSPENKINRERFSEAMAQANAWATIDTLVALAEEHGCFGDEFLSQAESVAKKNAVRRMVKQLKDASGEPVWASVETTNDDGKTVRVYKQETLFNVEDYRQVIGYHSDRSDYHRAMATGYATRCKKRFGKQIPTMFS